jgi:hypothetical protein
MIKIPALYQINIHLGWDIPSLRILHWLLSYLWVRIRVMALIATFNNISVILWRSALSVEETGVPWENYRPAQIYVNWKCLLIYLKIIYFGFLRAIESKQYLSVVSLKYVYVYNCLIWGNVYTGSYCLTTKLIGKDGQCTWLTEQISVYYKSLSIYLYLWDCRVEKVYQHIFVNIWIDELNPIPSVLKAHVME